MFITISKDKIVSYLISISTVALLFVFSFAMNKNNNEILQSSANAISNSVNDVVSNSMQNTTENGANSKDLNEMGNNILNNNCGNNVESKAEN